MIAALWGTTVGYMEDAYSVTIETTDGRVRRTSKKTFDSLYHRLDDYTAALKEDCIEYVECMGGCLPDLYLYPTWFYELFSESVNLPDDGKTILYCNGEEECIMISKRSSLQVNIDGDIVISSHSAFLCNRFGEVMGMDYFDFVKLYDTVGE